MCVCVKRTTVYFCSPIYLSMPSCTTSHILTLLDCSSSSSQCDGPSISNDVECHSTRCFIVDVERLVRRGCRQLLRFLMCHQVCSGSANARRRVFSVTIDHRCSVRCYAHRVRQCSSDHSTTCHMLPRSLVVKRRTIATSLEPCEQANRASIFAQETTTVERLEARCCASDSASLSMQPSDTLFYCLCVASPF